MDAVQMSRQGLILILKENRAKHIEEYNTALSGWHKDYMSQIEEEYRRVISPDWDGEKPFYMKEQRPVSYEEDYDDMISQLTHDVRETIELSQSDYRKYVLDRWDWKRQFMTSNSKYLG